MIMVAVFAADDILASKYIGTPKRKLSVSTWVSQCATNVLSERQTKSPDLPTGLGMAVL